MIRPTPVLKIAMLICAASTSLVSFGVYGGAIFESDTRIITGSATTLEATVLVDNNFSVKPASDFSLFNASDAVNATSASGNATASASAEQDSALTPILITGSGAGAASVAASQDAQAGARGSSTFSIDFRLDAAHQVSLIGELTGVDLGGARINFIDLTGAGSYVFQEFAPTGGGSISFNETWLLAAAHYRLVVVAGAEFQLLVDQIAAGSGTYDFRMTLTAVPEPATLALFGLGLAGIPFVRKRTAS